MSVKVTKDKTADLMRAIQELVKKDVLVGVPSDTTGRKDEGITNAMLGYIHENGSPANNIPARPHLVPAVRESSKELAGFMREAADAAFKQKPKGVIAAFKKAGLTAQNNVRMKITEGIDPQLAEATIAARQRKGRKSKGGKVGDDSSVTPLVDTGQYRKSITYVIRDKDK